MDEMYHSPCERSEFYTMSDMSKPPVLFTPAEDLDKLTSLEFGLGYGTNSECSDHSGRGNVLITLPVTYPPHPNWN
ncbi:unnamed protein product [Allacma fusca]|uniref:Uncharacterized protein n=1 Tax=Allacma fusca TaxID=39272 RepID=A0A8J2PIM2_9HEXA|nr:unnamed protein product [Allacma fusca]